MQPFLGLRTMLTSIHSLKDAFAVILFKEHILHPCAQIANTDVFQVFHNDQIFSSHPHGKLFFSPLLLGPSLTIQRFKYYRKCQ